MKTKLINVQGKGPLTKVKTGKFEVSTWHWKKTIPQPEETRDLFAEREVAQLPQFGSRSDVFQGFSRRLLL